MFKILYEDKEIIIIDKSYNLIVNRINNKINLISILNDYCPNLYKIYNNGLLHRIDKDTTGLLIISKSNFFYKKIHLDFLNKNNIKEYIALVSGDLITGGKINIGIIRDKKKKLCMTFSKNEKKSITHYRIIKRFKLFTLIRLNIETGRTHQIRVHMKYINHPIIGDYKYGKNISIFDKIHNFLNKNNIFINRYLLHSNRLTIKHPTKNIFMTWKSEIPNDIISFIYKVNEIL
ncbi:RluA family pseudouridine synthase [Candidatus Nardonella dryophthoridicola]|uniref:Pseudouridine synthase n=1 Tax=endosymbiont of Rhynchophorus ferrugineus TaxID=1972133 RepID=A0A2Z5TIT6_9GAMM|nr:RluA family pseudouridine synthase [Candidatus Nardonella dryophthoridicola]QTJ62896.1 RluA family pseudouridine synthase [Candidatus Nardonella dryophthoridicola]BBA85142.1 pseudouridine synthase [endosymbiont of Rhynchophorus ferrugineus]